MIGLDDDWTEELEKTNDEIEYYGLTPKQIEICKEAKSINKIKYEESDENGDGNIDRSTRGFYYERLWDLCATYKLSNGS